MEAKIKELGWIEKGTGKHQSNTVYDIGGGISHSNYIWREASAYYVY